MRRRAGQPGNIKAFDDRVGEIARAAGDAGVPIRIGVNAGSLDKRLLEKYGKATPEALVESALWEASLFEEHDFRDIKISVKHHDPVVMVQAYRQLSAACDYPLHLVSPKRARPSRGPSNPRSPSGRCWVRGSATRFESPLSAPPVEEVKVGLQIPNRSTCASAGWRSSPVRVVAGRKWMCTRWPSRSPQGCRDWRFRCGSRSWDVSSTVRGGSRG